MSQWVEKGPQGQGIANPSESHTVGSPAKKKLRKASNNFYEASAKRIENFDEDRQIKSPSKRKAIINFYEASAKRTQNLDEDRLIKSPSKKGSIEKHSILVNRRRKLPLCLIGKQARADSNIDRCLLVSPLKKESRLSSHCKRPNEHDQLEAKGSSEQDIIGTVFHRDSVQLLAESCDEECIHFNSQSGAEIVVGTTTISPLFSAHLNTNRSSIQTKVKRKLLHWKARNER